MDRARSILIGVCLKNLKTVEQTLNRNKHLRTLLVMRQKEVRSKLLENRESYLFLLKLLAKQKMSLVNWMIWLRRFPPKILEGIPGFLSLLMIIHKEQKINHQVRIDCKKDLIVLQKLSTSPDSKILQTYKMASKVQIQGTVKRYGWD